MTKTELINRRWGYRNQRSQKQLQAYGLAQKLERLKKAKLEFAGIIEDSNYYKKKITNLEIDPGLWKGETEKTYKSDHQNSMEKSISGYIVHLKKVEDGIDNEIERLTTQLTNCQSDIAHLNTSIANITMTISTLKEE
ncbi:DUF5082 family protein [Sporosarcina sp. Marseille-Q4063]|uniref:YwqH-like family protein n=1 Tax=Sporosarcina sp. Marseille-Q4063 TaxID=2810514 RepID=UPI001BB07121|nr:DUF5082 family protein [Sporosarcina sp. Marseille-Q4063]QUW20795.1 DUF5082 family protein [Sporosarcina sp. Marseille-Q4063]